MLALVTAIISQIAPYAIAAGGALIAAIVWGFHQRLAGAKAERNAQKAKEADAYEQHLKDLSNAAAAGNAVHPGDSLHDDPFNRDR